MRLLLLVCAVSAGALAGAAPSAAAVVISDQATANMSCSAGRCTPTAVDAVLNVQDLANLLAAGNATVTTTGAGVQARNIRLDARLDWSTATKLSLDAFHSIEFHRSMTVTGGGAVTLITNDGGSGGDFACIDHGRLQFANLSSALRINGTAYALVNSVASLATAIAVNPFVAVALANNYDAKKDGTYTTSPITTVFGGSFNGLGNAISNLSINDTTENAYVGLFAETTISGSSMIANVRLVNESVRGSSYTGGFVGEGPVTLVHSFNTGSVRCDNCLVGGWWGTGLILLSFRIPDRRRQCPAERPVV